MKKQILIPGITAVILVAIAIAFLMPMGASANEIEVDMYEFGYIVKDGSLPLKLRAGEEYTLKITNIGGVEHEFMIVTDPDRVNSDIKSLVNDYLAQGMSFDEIFEALEEEHHELEEEWESEGIFIDVVRLGPGQSDVMTLKFDSPGTYYIVCLVLKGSAPDTHADMGMKAELIVEA